MVQYRGEYYWTRTTKDLQTLRSKKHNKLTKLEHEPITYFSQQEIRKLRTQIGQIDAVLTAQFYQEEMFRDL